MPLSKYRSIVCTTALLLAPAVHAQYDPGASAMLGAGHGFTALSQSTMSNAFRATEAMKQEDQRGPAATRGDAGKRSQGATAGGVKLKPGFTQADVDRYMAEREAFHKRALAPEYHRRARTDGEASAQRWLRARSHEIGKQEGAKARQLFAQQ